MRIIILKFYIDLIYELFLFYFFILGKGDLAFPGDSAGEIQERQDQDSSSSIIYPQVIYPV